MSLAALTTRNVKATPLRKAARPETSERETVNTLHQPAVQSAIEVLTEYIPSEVIGLYVAGVGILKPGDFGKWLVFGLALLLIPFVIWLSLMIKRRQNTHLRIDLAAERFWAITGIAVAAFVAWAAALPNTPFETFSVNATQYGGFAVLVLAVVLPMVGQALGLNSPKGSA